MDEEEDEEESALAFVDPSAHVAATLESTAAAAPKKRKRGKAANVPLDADGLPMEWDESTGAWVEAVGFTAGPQGLSEQWVQTRLSQTLMHLEKLRSGGGVHGTSLITHDELSECREMLDLALAGVLRDPALARQRATASSVFWAIALAQSVAACRVGGWLVDSEDAVDAWSMARLHDWLTHFRSEATKVDETGKAGGGAPATRISAGRGSGGRGAAAQGGMKGGGGGGDELKRRRLRIDALGDEAARREKLRALDELLRAGGGDGLAQPILLLQPPGVRELARPLPSAEAAALPGSAALPGGRGGARAALLARWGGTAVRRTEERSGGELTVPVLRHEPSAAEETGNDSGVRHAAETAEHAAEEEDEGELLDMIGS